MKNEASFLIPKLDQTLVSIDAYITDPEDLKEAHQQVSSIRDYAAGDIVACTPRAALDNCLQIKGYFPEGTPPAVFAQVDEIFEDITRLENKHTFGLGRIIGHPLFLCTIIIALAAFTLTRCQQ